MTMEIPEFKRCCFCLPLRPGLLAWGYFKIVAGVLIIPVLAYFVIVTVMMGFMGGNNKYLILSMLYNAVAITTLILYITDFVATIVFIVGGHTKNVNLIRGFYIFCIGELIVTILLMLGAVGITILRWVHSNMTQSLVVYTAFLVILVVKAYFILLLRSEIIKLKSSGEFRFVNNSAEAEAQCMMTSKKNEAEIENA